MKEYIGVEIGGTKQQVASFDENGKMLKIFSEKIKLVNGASDILEWMKEKIPQLITENTAGIGIGFGGIVNTKTGRSAGSVHVKGWDEISLNDWFSSQFGLPATAINDTVCGGYAEVLFGTGRGKDIFFYTNIGTGCGGALFVHGVNYDGNGWGTSYFGQQFVPAWEDNGDIIRVEKVCAGSFWEKRMQMPGYIPESSLLYKMLDGHTEKVKCPDLCEAARKGDEWSLKEIDKWALRYSTALCNLMSLLSPDRVSIGGGVANNGDILFDPIKKHCEELAFISFKGKYDIVKCDTMDNAVLIGAAMYARDGFKRL